MSRSGRKKAGPGPANAWESTLQHVRHAEPTQAGEVMEGLEEGRGGGDKGRDTETGSGGYGGDAVEAGLAEAEAQPERPVDAEIHGDPRTPVGSSYPDDAEPDERRPPGGSRVSDEEED